MMVSFETHFNALLVKYILETTRKLIADWCLLPLSRGLAILMASIVFEQYAANDYAIKVIVFLVPTPLMEYRRSKKSQVFMRLCLI